MLTYLSKLSYPSTLIHVKAATLLAVYLQSTCITCSPYLRISRQNIHGCKTFQKGNLSNSKAVLKVHCKYSHCHRVLKWEFAWRHVKAMPTLVGIFPLWMFPLGKTIELGLWNTEQHWSLQAISNHQLKEGRVNKSQMITGICQSLLITV